MPPVARSFIFSFVVSIASATAQAQSSEAVARLASRYVELRTRYDPTLAIEAGLPLPEAPRFSDRRPAALHAQHAAEDSLLAEVRGLGASTDRTVAILREELESRRALRVCRPELWDLSHTEGWQAALPALAAIEPVATGEQRQQAIALWNSLPDFLERDIANLRAGLATGYSVPRPVVLRVLRQLDALITAKDEQSPFYSPASRSGDSAFSAELRRAIDGPIQRAIERYADFLRVEYLPRARTSIGVSALPDGARCYRAYLRRLTTTTETPRDVFQAGERLVSQSAGEIVAIGQRRFQSTRLNEVIRRVHDDPDNRFRSADELVEFSRAVVAKSVVRSRPLFTALPEQPVTVAPLPAFQRGSGVSSHYQPNPNEASPATFWIADDQWKTTTRGSAEITAVHETVPGHHLQITTARRSDAGNPLSAVIYNAAYVEGWANYAERLSEEIGTDDDDFERVQRRVLAGRSLMIDPGIHVFGWSRRRAEAFAMETGMSRGDADDVIDRVIVEPAQLTSYEVGGLKILALREEARRRLGSRFDIAAFHQEVLAPGPIPLRALETRIHQWMRTVSGSSQHGNAPRAPTDEDLAVHHVLQLRCECGGGRRGGSFRSVSATILAFEPTQTTRLRPERFAT